MQEGLQTDATCNIQQCWELLPKNLASVCTGLRNARKRAIVVEHYGMRFRAPYFVTLTPARAVKMCITHFRLTCVSLDGLRATEEIDRLLVVCLRHRRIVCL